MSSAIIAACQAAAAPYKNYASSTHTGFPHGIDFGQGDYDIDLTWGEEDLVVVKKKGGRKTEVHILSSASGYQQFILHTETGLHETGNDWTFLVAKNRDLVCINRINGNKKTDVHILSASSGYKDFCLHISTCLHSTASPSWHFSIADNNDIYVVAAPGGSGNLELHILDAKTNYTTFKHQQNCNIKASPDWAWWSVAKNEGRSLIAVARQANGNPTEVHIRPKPYTNWSLETPTVAPCTEDKNRFRFALASSNDVGIFGCKDGSSLELYILSAGNQIYCPPAPPSAVKVQCKYVTYPLFGVGPAQLGAAHVGLAFYYPGYYIETHYGTDKLGKLEDVRDYPKNTPHMKDRRSPYFIKTLDSNEVDRIKNILKKEFHGKKYSLGTRDCFSLVERFCALVGVDKKKLPGMLGNRHNAGNAVRHNFKTLSLSTVGCGRNLF